MKQVIVLPGVWLNIRQFNVLRNCNKKADNTKFQFSCSGLTPTLLLTTSSSLSDLDSLTYVRKGVQQGEEKEEWQLKIDTESSSYSALIRRMKKGELGARKGRRVRMRSNRADETAIYVLRTLRYIACWNTDLITAHKDKLLGILHCFNVSQKCDFFDVDFFFEKETIKLWSWSIKRTPFSVRGFVFENDFTFSSLSRAKISILRTI